MERAEIIGIACDEGLAKRARAVEFALSAEGFGILQLPIGF
jgi:hypothetical protein